MNKKLFVLLIILMSMSLIGIIFVQGYWISNSVQNKRDQFAFNAKRALAAVASEIQNREFESYYYPFQKLVDSLGVPDDLTFDEYFLIEEDPLTNETFLYRNGILQQDIKLTSPSLDFDLDSVEIKRYYSRSVRQILDKNTIDGSFPTRTSTDRIQEYYRLQEFEKRSFQELVTQRTKKIPIHKRVEEAEIERLMTLELVELGMETDFEFGIYSNGLATRVHSENFVLDNAYSNPLFEDSAGQSDYVLYANFPGEKKFVISAVIGMAILSIVFTIIIVVAYSSALNQLNKQRQISQIKTDFINNMTHEFKTPIATINLALDAMKNAKVSSDPDKVSYYQKMIRDENKRMHAQVENVLRISKLEKNELDIRKERFKLHDIIEDAVIHVSLIVENREGYIKTHLDAVKSSILANETHFTNVVVNMLDNAVKYSSEAPKIDVYTENVKDFILLKITDQGDGMSKSVQRKIFQKFYREHTGDIHNVKGHGLGLSYVKQIVDDHQGTIHVESEKGSGSTFIIKLPLIS